MNKYFIGILLIIVIVFLYIRNKRENMGVVSNLYTNNPNTDTKSTKSNTYANQIVNIKSGTRTYDDALFDDVKSYENDPNDELNTGVYKCLDSCSGACVEYGMTGLAYCFPKEKN